MTETIWNDSKDDPWGLGRPNGVAYTHHGAGPWPQATIAEGRVSRRVKRLVAPLAERLARWSGVLDEYD